MSENRYYVRRIECWGGIYHYCVADSETRRQVSQTYILRRTAETKRDRMNKDLERFRAARASPYCLPPA